MRENNRNSRDDKSKSEDRKKSFESGKKGFTSSSSKKPDGKRKSFSKAEGGSSFGADKEFKSEREFGAKKDFGAKKEFGAKREFGAKKEFGTRKPSRFGSDRNSDTTKEPRSFNPRFKSEDNSEKNPYGKPSETKGRSYVKSDPSKSRSEKSGTGASKDVRPFRKRAEADSYRTKNVEFRERKAKPTAQGASHNLDGKVRLNRYIANAGICSRRKADELIEAGVISVNNEVVSELGFKVDPSKDVVKYNGALLKREKKVYVLLNKPKDYITTTDDPQERRTVMQLVEKASRERIYPVGRLDRNTTGLLLMTNDGDLADKLSHPKNGITKIYQVELNRNLSQGDLNKIQFGLELEDGLIKPDSVSYVTGGNKKEIGIQIHSGKNRIVRRIFEHLGYEVVKLDRVVYGNLTKKDLPRGRWRYLDEHELIQIKHLIK